MLQEPTPDLSGMNGNWVWGFVDLAGGKQILPGDSENGGWIISCPPWCCCVTSLLSSAFYATGPCKSWVQRNHTRQPSPGLATGPFCPNTMHTLLLVSWPNYLSSTHILFPWETKYLDWHLPKHGLHRRCFTVKSHGQRCERDSVFSLSLLGIHDNY